MENRLGSVGPPQERERVHLCVWSAIRRAVFTFTARRLRRDLCSAVVVVVVGDERRSRSQSCSTIMASDERRAKLELARTEEDI